jgi:hypothetical protein
MFCAGEPLTVLWSLNKKEKETGHGLVLLQLSKKLYCFEREILVIGLFGRQVKSTLNLI